MKTKLRQIGGSKGVIIPKVLLDEIVPGTEAFEIELFRGSIVLTPIADPFKEFKDFFDENPDFVENGLED